MRLTRRVRSFFREEAWDFPEHERPVVAGSPATPEHALTLRIAYAFVAILVGLTGGLGNALVIVNIKELQTGLALSAVQAAWLPTAYVMTNISANLLLIKFRQQYGLRVFTLIALGRYALLSLTYLLTADHWLTLTVRAASGFVAASLTPLCLFYVMQALPGRWRVRGLILGLGISQCAFPLASVISPWLSAGSHWQSIFLLEAGLAILSFAAVGAFRLPPAEQQRVFEPLDFLTFLLLGGSLALIAAVLGLGRLEGWFETQWILFFLSLALPMLIAALMLENGRTAPLLNMRWLGSRDVARFALATLMARIVLAEQNVATALLTALGGSDEDLRALSLVILVGSVAGVIVSAVTVNVEKLVMPMMLAVTAIAVAAFVDSSATGLDHLPRLYLSQAAISFSAMFFLGPALVFGITSALQKGSRELLSFIVLFGAINSIGALSGQALFGTYIDSIVTISQDWVLAHQSALRLAAVLSFITRSIWLCSSQFVSAISWRKFTGGTSAQRRCRHFRSGCLHQAANRNTLASSVRAVSYTIGLERYGGNRSNIAFGSGMAARAVSDIHGVDVYAYHLSISPQCQGSATSRPGRGFVSSNVIWRIADGG